MSSHAWSVVADGIVVAVRLTPKGGRDAIDGEARLSNGQTVLTARVRAPPREGEANAALVRLIAKAAGVAPRNVTLVSGATARVKRLKITGDPEQLSSALIKNVGEIVERH